MPRKKKRKTSRLLPTWLTAEEEMHNLSRSKAFTVMEVYTGLTYNLNRYYEWNNKVRQIPAPAKHHMISRSLRYCLLKAGLLNVSEDAVAQVIDDLTD